MDDLLRATERILPGVRATEAELLREQRSTVARVWLEEAEVSTVIVKRAGDGFDPEGDDAAARSYFAEHAALTMLNGGIAPRCLGSDPEAGVLVLDDLGEGQSLADLLLADDETAAHEGLRDFAAVLGRMHAVTAGRRADFEKLWGAATNDPGPRSGPAAVRDGFVQACEIVGLHPPDEEVADVLEELVSPGAWDALTHADACPDNNLITAGGMRLFDFEFAAFRHALVDASYWHVPFPTCWCANALPDPLRGELDAIYRAELIAGCEIAGDDERYGKAMARVHAFWVMSSIAWVTPEVFERDGDWGISSVRQRILYRLPLLAEAIATALPGLAATAAELARRLASRWPEVESMPLYPALRT